MDQVLVSLKSNTQLSQTSEGGKWLLLKTLSRRLARYGVRGRKRTPTPRGLVGDSRVVPQARTNPASATKCNQVRLEPLWTARAQDYSFLNFNSTSCLPWDTPTRTNTEQVSICHRLCTAITTDSDGRARQCSLHDLPRLLLNLRTRSVIKYQLQYQRPTSAVLSR